MEYEVHYLLTNDIVYSINVFHEKFTNRISPGYLLYCLYEK